jgi:hypothetical protein
MNILLSPTRFTSIRHQMKKFMPKNVIVGPRWKL